MLWAIKAPLWPRIELFSSQGQETWYRESTKILHLGCLSGILQDKVRMLGAVILCSLSEHIFCYALLTLRCSCVNKWHALHEASWEPCSAVPPWSHTAYGTNLSGAYTNLPMPRGTQHLHWEPTRNGDIMWTKLSFLSQIFGLFDHFITPRGLEVLT